MRLVMVLSICGLSILREERERGSDSGQKREEDKSAPFNLEKSDDCEQAMQNSH